jgi:ectoine hydroxylase-related dioxygenase (phytanoyl-CoA dioxygenase family)
VARIAELLVEARRDPTWKAGGTPSISNIMELDAVFKPAWRSPIIHAAVARILTRGYRLERVNYRGPLPGFGAQALHEDWTGPGRMGDYQAATAIVALVDFDAHNGATRVVPGSQHDAHIRAPKHPDAPYRGERIIAMRAGSALIINGHLWHSGTRNRSSAPRHSLQISFVRT